MNLRVDLILPSERRSAGPISLKSVARVTTIVVPALLLMLLGWALLNMMVRGSELRVLEGRWEIVQPRQARASEIASQLQTNRQVRAELRGWNRSRIEWHEFLTSLAAQVPTNIQLRTLNVSQVLETLDDEVPARRFSMSLAGRAEGREAGAAIDRLQARLEGEPAFTNHIESVVISDYGEDRSAGAAEFDRVFKLDCKFKLRAFGETSGRSR